ncbi:hypothetical protein ACFV6E_07915 [Streptomyces sp. NPDC059785]|uniref:hypothetical protein n=1 Tax=unclassified Streptomyces TaxID=2593676 RepID=UPI0036554D40
MAIGDVTYTDMLCGRISFTQTGDRTVRMAGQFNEGFADADATSCLLYAGEVPPKDLIRDLGARIIPPGTTEFEADFEDVTIADFTGVPIRVFCDNDIIGIGDPAVPAE